MEYDLVEIMCEFIVLYYALGCVSRSSFHAKTFPPSVTWSFLLFALCCRGFSLVRLCYLCMQLLGALFRVFLSKDLALTFAWITFDPSSLCNQGWFCHLCKYISVPLLQLFHLVFSPQSLFLVWVCLAGKSQWVGMHSGYKTMALSGLRLHRR